MGWIPPTAVFSFHKLMKTLGCFLIAEEAEGGHGRRGSEKVVASVKDAYGGGFKDGRATSREG